MSQALVLALLSYAFASILIGSLTRLLLHGGIVARNFRGCTIPTGAGVAIPLAALIPFGIAPWFGIAVARTSLWLSLLFGMTLLGLLDDTAGDRSRGGFVAHFRSLLAGGPTTGALKAVFGGLIALYAGCSLHQHFIPAITSAAVIALATNAVNLLDVRPGRALKGYLLLFLLGALSAGLSGIPSPWGGEQTALAVIPLGAALALWKGDNQGRLMLGDAGSNALGGSAGMWLATAPIGFQAVMIVLFVWLHLYAERRSITELIARVPLLDHFDRWGRS